MPKTGIICKSCHWDDSRPFYGSDKTRRTLICPRCSLQTYEYTEDRYDDVSGKDKTGCEKEVSKESTPAVGSWRVVDTRSPLHDLVSKESVCRG